VEEGFERVMDVTTALIHMYGRCRSLDDARRIFDGMVERTSVTWNYMIRVYSCYGQDVPAKQLLEQMNQEGVLSDKFIASSMISAYATKVALREGKWIHASLMGTAFETDTVVSTALLNMYCKCGSLIHARSVFDKMTTRDAVSWNAMMDGYAQYGDVMNVQAFFNFMQKEGVAPDTATFVSSLSACARLVALTEGRQFYNGSILRGFEGDTAIATAIFNMYAKCGSIQEALQMFENMPEKNEVSWSAMIAAYSRHGHGKEALLLFDKMLGAGCQPNEVTFVSVLYACSHAGLLEEGRKWWYAMRYDYGITPIPDHFDCMIDLYSRMGQLEEAEDLIKDMPIDPTAISWMTLLSACRSKTDLCRGARAAKRILDLDASDPSPHPILHNLYYIDSSREECDGTGN
jgi:pentatricopeptide repeat protein